MSKEMREQINKVKNWNQFLNEGKSKKQLDNEYYAVMGGKNTTNPPFNVGDIIKQKYTTDKDGNLIDGREEYEFVGMKGNMMLLKTLNSYAAKGEDIFSDEAVKKNTELVYKPEIGQTLQLHYMYADRFQTI
jgi:hypothetical protein